MIDLHSHVLPGLDDGARDLAESLDICRAAAAEGITVLAGTPHVRGDYRTTPEQMEEAFALVQAAAVDIIRLVPGGEISTAELTQPVEWLRRFALAGNPGYLLVETPYYAWPEDFAARIARLGDDGIRAVLAHPERNPAVQDNPKIVQEIVDAGALVQVTAASLDGRAGWESQVCALKLLDLRLVHLLASDAHAASVRAVGMNGAVKVLEDDELARWLTVDVPRSIVDRSDLPDRPGRR